MPLLQASSTDTAASAAPFMALSQAPCTSTPAADAAAAATTTSSSSSCFHIDLAFEFDAPQYYDFTASETPSQVEAVERWFETSASHGASPFSIRSREVILASNRDEEDPDGDQMDICTSPREEAENQFKDPAFSMEDGFGMVHVGNNANGMSLESKYNDLVDVDLYTPAKPCVASELAQSNALSSFSPGSLPAKRVHEEISKKVPHTEKSISTKNYLLRKPSHIEKTVRHDVQAIKKQKLDGGRHRQIISAKDEKQATKTPLNLTVPHSFNFSTERRLARGAGVSSVTKVVRPRSPFVSMAEKVQRFQMKTRECFPSVGLSHDERSSSPQEKMKMRITKPREPDLETSQRVRPARVKSTAELEAEMLAKMPKFKARPLNKKILEAPELPALPKSKPTLPEFHEFHLRTTERALQHCGTSSMCSTDSSMFEELRYRPKSIPAKPREPQLATAARARPPKVKSTEEREQEELAKVPKFKARPLDKKIFYSRGDLGIFRSTKRQVTMPEEFHFATDQRIHCHPEVPLDLFSQLSLRSQQENHPPKPTKPEPFHLLTEDRGQKKHDRMLTELKENELRERDQRIPKANPLPYTTDYPEVPPKPEPKECTRPQPFCLESVLRHEEEMARIAEEKYQLELEEAERRKFHAQPITCLGPVFVPERSTIPLTEAQEFSLKVDTRAAERADFDRKVAEKLNNYKRFREEYEAARRAEEDQLIKYMRQTMVPHARPVPSFDKPFVPKRCMKEPTRPCSPKLHVSQRRERRNSLTFRRQSLTFSIQKRVQMR